VARASRASRRDSNRTRPTTVNKPARLTAEERAIKRAADEHAAKYPKNPTNEQYFRYHAAHYGCDPNSKGQCRVFSQTLNAICSGKRRIVAGLLVDAMMRAKLRYPPKPPSTRLTALEVMRLQTGARQLCRHLRPDANKRTRDRFVRDFVAIARKHKRGQHL